MFATNGVQDILGLSPTQLIGKSFYFCIAENCLQDAVRCLESAKSNDSIAYLRFWYRDPMQDEQRQRSGSAVSDDDDDEGGVAIRTEPAPIENPTASIETPMPMTEPDAPRPTLEHSQSDSRYSSGNSTDLNDDAASAVFDPPAMSRSSSSLTPLEDFRDDYNAIEIEAVVSCTSDGLVVILRRAKPLTPSVLGQSEPYYANGLFASPWATEPVIPENAPSAIPPEASDPPGLEPEPASFMSAIRQVAVFAWSLTGINGNIAQYGRGNALGESLPPDLPIWDPKASGGDDRYNGFVPSMHRPLDDPESRKETEDNGTSSGDEVVWKRVPVMPPIKRPVRRGREEAFGEEEHEDSGGVDVGEERAKQRRKFRES